MSSDDQPFHLVVSSVNYIREADVVVGVSAFSSSYFSPLVCNINLTNPLLNLTNPLLSSRHSFHLLLSGGVCH